MNISHILVRTIEQVYFGSIHIVVTVKTYMYMYLIEQTDMIESLDTSYFSKFEF